MSIGRGWLNAPPIDDIEILAKDLLQTTLTKIFERIFDGYHEGQGKVSVKQT